MYNPQLETFITAADCGSFNRAAELLFITPTAVIKQINLLENSLGVKLFDRSHRGLTLTKAGISLYNDAKYIVQYCKDAVNRAQNAMQNDTDVIRIGASPMTPAQPIMELWPAIHEHCPEIKFQIVPFDNTPENAREILANLGQNIDIVAGVFDETMLSLRDCDGFELTRAPLCVAVSIYHPLAERTHVSVEELYGENLLMMYRNWSHYVDALRDELLGKHPQISIEDIDLYRVEVFNRCESGNDILLVVPQWASVHPLIKVIPVDWNHSMPYGLLHSKTPSNRVKRFLDALREIER